MGATAPDIITYVGVPLAVLGVIPIMYTFVNSLVTLRHIQRILRRNFINAMTRSSFISGIVEVEIPRKSLQPLDRSEPDYFRTSPCRSQLKGGSWTALNWRELNIGTKVYRLVYHDELVQPQAEIELEPLIAFLLDRGAVPSQQGFADLRNSGLWTPTGTKLLLSPCTSDPVLSVSSSEDSDGILSLQLDWRHEWDKRGPQDLPPYWTRIHPPWDGKSKTISEEEASGKRVSKTSLHEVDEKSAEDSNVETDALAVTLKDANTEPSSPTSEPVIPPAPRSSIRLKIGSEGLVECFYEDSPKAFFPCRHLKAHYNEPAGAATWFTSAATALRAHEGGLWAYAVPAEVLALAARETIPCGIMVLLGALAEDAVPAWRTPSAFDEKLEQHERQTKQMERLRRFADEARLPPDEQRKAREKRMQQELAEMQYEMKKRRLEDERRREMEIQEALRSQRLPVKKVADANRLWLVQNADLPDGSTLPSVVERLLWDMMHQPETVQAVVDVLEAWKGWADAGGMTKAHFDEIKKNQVAFAYASCVLSLIADSVVAGPGSVVSDMQECLRMWKKVRLG